MKVHSRNKLIIVIAVVVTVSLIASVLLVVQGYSEYGDMKNEAIIVVSSLEAAMQSLEPLTQFTPGNAASMDFSLKSVDLEEARQHFARAERSLVNIDEKLDSYGWIIALGKKMPWTGPRLRTMSRLLNIAGHASTAGQDICNGIKPTRDVIQSISDATHLYTTGELVSEIIIALEEGRPYFSSAREELDIIATESAMADFSVLPESYVEMIDIMIKQIPELRDILDTAIESPELARTALGFDEPRTYLVLTHSNDEIGPTGGLITVYAEITLENGEVTGHLCRPCYAPELKEPEVDEPIEIPSWWFLFREPIWVYWDGNWVSDFPTAAQQAEWFYEEGGNVEEPLDGVVAIDMTGMQYILQALGPVTVPGAEEPVTGSNLQKSIYTHQPEHKEFIVELAEVLIDKLKYLESGEITAGLSMFLQAMEEKHIMLYFDDSALNKLTTDMGWSGAIDQEGDDYIYVVDATWGATKASATVDERIDYRAVINSDNSISAVTTIHYYYNEEKVATSPACLYYGCPQDYYWTYVRLYVPKGSKLIKTEGNRYPAQVIVESGKTAYGNLVRVPLGEEVQITYSYLIPAAVSSVRDGCYRLVVQKQPGTFNNQLYIELSFPAEIESVSSNSGVEQVQGNLVQFRTALNSDREFEVLFKR